MTSSIVFKIYFSNDEEKAAFADFRNATLRNKNHLQKENRELTAEVEKVAWVWNSLSWPNKEIYIESYQVK